MALLPPAIATPDPNPFLPDFGQEPNILVGRGSLSSDLLGGLATGPTDKRFCTILLGPRGSGKTVFQTQIENTVMAAGWIVLAVDSSTSGLLGRIKQSIVNARDIYEGTANAHPDADYARRFTGIQGVGVGFNWENFNPRPDWNIRHLLSDFAYHAAQQNTAILLTVDEMQAGDHQELRRLASDLQHIIKKDQLPLAFLGAGLSNMKHMLLADKKITFFHRCEKKTMPPLRYHDVLVGLRNTILEAGGEIDSEALKLAAESVGDLPYKFQLLGYHMWRLAGAPASTVDEDSVRLALEITDDEMAEQLYTKCWQDLSDAEQTYLRVVAAKGSTDRTSIAQAMQSSPRGLVELEERLRDMGYIQATNGDHPTEICVTSLLPRRYILEIVAKENLYTLEAGLDFAPRKLCNKYMPRARNRCALPYQHKWGCRTSPYHSSKNE